jgi:hypothetical protein
MKAFRWTFLSSVVAPENIIHCLRCIFPQLCCCSWAAQMQNSVKRSFRKAD